MPCFGGMTTRYVKKVEASMGMPIDSEIIAIPAVYNVLE